MRVSLSVTLEKGENNEQLISAHFDIDDSITTLEAETYHMLLSAVTSQMLMMKASETQSMLIESLKVALQAIDNGIVLMTNRLGDGDDMVRSNMEKLQSMIIQSAIKDKLEDKDSDSSPGVEPKDK